MSESSEKNAATELQKLAEVARSLESRATFVVTGQSDLFRLSLTQDLRKEFLSTDVQQAVHFAERTPMEYMSWRQVPDNHVMWTPVSGVSFLSVIGTSEDDSKRLVPVPTFDVEGLSSRNLKMTITTTAPESDPTNIVTFYRITRNTARLARSRRVAAIFRNGAFDKLDDEVVLFNQEVDAISSGGFIFFLRKGQFERSFGFVEQLKRQAAETFESTVAHLRVRGCDELRGAATTDINMMAKMASIRRKLERFPRYAESLNMTNLLKFVDENPHVDVEIAGEGDDRCFVFQTGPAFRYKILKLLDDDFLTSNLTELDYLVDSKGDPLGR